MLALPVGIIAILKPFSPLFSKRVWASAPILLIGAILSQQGRTVSNALRVMGLAESKRFERYHRVLNRANWSCLMAAKILLGLLISLLSVSAPILIGVDDTLERRKGKRIDLKGSHRDPIRSSHAKMVSCFGIKWLAMMLIVQLPWNNRPWALPFLTIPIPPKAYYQAKRRQHQTTIDRCMQGVQCISRWLAKRPWRLIGDGHFGSAALALHCISRGAVLISRLRLDARLFDFPDQQLRVGRPSPAGKRLPTLEQVAKADNTKWQTMTVNWYGQAKKELRMVTGVCLWYASKMSPFPIRWVLVKDPSKPDECQAFFSTQAEDTAQTIIEQFVLRWNVEVTFQESRRHLGFETQRQWSKKAMARTTPIILGLYSLVCLMGVKLKVYLKPFAQNSAWYMKNDVATFSDVLAVVRRQIWSARYLSRCHKQADFFKLPANDLNFIINQLANSG